MGRKEIIQSSKAFQSWTIIPQLEGLEVILMGPNMAAESVSHIRIVYTAVTSASEIAIKASSPIGFDFGGAVLGDKATQSLIVNPPRGEEIRIAMQIVAGQRYTIDIEKVRLGKSGGQTTFDLSTYTGGMFQSGEWVPGNGPSVAPWKQSPKENPKST